MTNWKSNFNKTCGGRRTQGLAWRARGESWTTRGFLGGSSARSPINSSMTIDAFSYLFFQNKWFRCMLYIVLHISSFSVFDSKHREAQNLQLKVPPRVFLHFPNGRFSHHPAALLSISQSFNRTMAGGPIMHIKRARMQRTIAPQSSLRNVLFQ